MTQTTTDRITPAEFARCEGVSKATVSRWIRDGRISLGVDGLLDLATAREERALTESPFPQHQATAALYAELSAAKRVTPTTTPPAPLPESPPVPSETLQTQLPLSPTAEIAAKLKYETFRLQKAKADLANLELEKAAGALLVRGEVEFVLADFGASLQQQMTTFADRAVPAVLAAKDAAGIHAAIEQSAQEVLTDMALAMRRRIQETLPHLSPPHDMG